MTLKNIKLPESGDKVEYLGDGVLKVPDNPIIPFIQGDGIGPDIWCAAKRVFDEAVKKTYDGSRQIEWLEVYAGQLAYDKLGVWLPEDTLKAVKEFKVAIKGPLTTPVGGGIRSLNVTLRQELDLFACVRPIRHFEGVPSPVKNPESVNMVIFRENTEDVYSGIEWPKGDENNIKLQHFLKNELGVSVREDSGIGIKPISVYGTQRIVRKAIQFALAKKRKNLTLVHKGNIMKFTEGSFKEWGYQLAEDEFKDQVIAEKDLSGEEKGDMLVIKDRIADAMFQQILLRPKEYDVIATTNLNGDYLSDALLAQVGGLGLGPGANISDECALFEATHGTAPKYANQDKVNPGSVILSGVMMLEHLDWDEAGALIIQAIEKTIKQKKVTYDLARMMDGAILLKCSEFADQIIQNMD